MKKALFIFIVFFQVGYVRAQGHNTTTDEENHITITTDLAQYALLQPNIGIEYRKNDRIAYGANLGYVIPDGIFSVNALADGQYKMPGTIYNGPALRLYIDYFRLKKPKSYWSTQFVIKDLWYNNARFIDSPDGDEPFYYTMSEKSIVTGLEFIHGHQWGTHSHIYADFFYGFGIHVRFRTFNVLSSTDPYEGSYLAEGTYKGYICYPTPVVGLRLGFNVSKKPKLADKQPPADNYPPFNPNK